MSIILRVLSDGDLSVWSMQAVDWSGNTIGSVGNAREQLVEDPGGSGPLLQLLGWPGYGGGVGTVPGTL